MERLQQISRRGVVKGAVWSTPVIAAAIATPASAASIVNVGDFYINGTCGVTGLLFPGFVLTAGSTALPAGTTILITTGGVNIGLLSLTPSSVATVTLLANNNQIVTLNSPLAAGASLQMRTTANVGVGSTVTATVTLPTGYVAGSGAKTIGQFKVTLLSCSAS
ncbi:MAG: hypothetical protein QM632_07020 [Micrococcaceae bacterium]